jgi:dTDP-4-dehydrorhamnose reductase
MLTGKNGQVGWELNRSLLPLGEIIALDRSQADLSKPESLRSLVQELRPDIIVNAAAYTAVDKAEVEEELATTVNGIAPGVLAEEAKKLGALLVHYSTDYVFDGTKETPYLEDDKPNPINAYGRSKLRGEEVIQHVGPDFLIFRTSWVYASRGRNFLQTILRLAKEKDQLSIVADQVGTPTWARLIAETTMACLLQTVNDQHKSMFKPDVYHLTSNGSATWYAFAKKIVGNARRLSNMHLQVRNITRMSTEEYPTPAKRPKNSRLENKKLKDVFNLSLPNWEQSLSLCIDEMCAQYS